MAYLSRSSRAASARTLTIGLVSEAWVGWADGGSREVVVPVVVVVGDSPTEGVVPCARVIVGTVGAFCGEPTFEGFAHRFGQERAGDGVSCREYLRVECSHAWRCPVARSEDAQLVIGEAANVGVFALVGSGSAVRSRRLARVRASAVSASARDEAVASGVIVCPSSQQPYSYSPSVKYGGGMTRR